MLIYLGFLSHISRCCKVISITLYIRVFPLDIGPDMQSHVDVEKVVTVL